MRVGEGKVCTLKVIQIQAGNRGEEESSRPLRCDVYIITAGLTKVLTLASQKPVSLFQINFFLAVNFNKPSHSSLCQVPLSASLIHSAMEVMILIISYSELNLKRNSVARSPTVEAIISENRLSYSPALWMHHSTARPVAVP